MTAPAAAPPRPGDLLELVAGEAAHGGWCVARTGEVGQAGARVVFVRHALPGETVLARLQTAGESDRFWRADAVEVLSASPHRVTPPCPPFRSGGNDRLEGVDEAQRYDDGARPARYLVNVECEPTREQNHLRRHSRAVPVPLR